MGLNRWRRDGPRMVIVGDLFQISGVGGDVKIGERPPFRLAVAAPDPLRPERAREQPSRMLLARHQVVPFAGREQELAGAATWLDGTEPMAVRLIHAAGGQGKSRLAAEITANCAASGGTVWQVTHAAVPIPHPAPASRFALGDGPVLAVVDYADRWPADALVALFTYLRDLGAAAGVLVRVLCLGRSSHLWWQTVTKSVRDGENRVDDMRLGSLAVDQDRATLFITAAARFAAVLGVPPRIWTPPGVLDDGRFDQILAVHMAALAAVDAHQRGAAKPTEPHAISAYLLEREFDFWHDRKVSPQTLHRTVCAATLTGALPWSEAQGAVQRVGLASDQASAGELLDEHLACYPPEDQRTVFEPLCPDRLGEDLIALSMPGHGFRAAVAPTDPWTLDAVPKLLLTRPKRRPQPSAWAPTVVTVLVETAYRWPHVAAEVLYPILRRTPELAVAAGGATLTRLAGIPGVDLAMLAAVDELLPAERTLDLDVAAAAISTALAEYRLTRASGPVERAGLLYEHAWRQSRVGEWPAAVAAAEDSADLYRRLIAVGRPHRTDLAYSLDALSYFRSILKQPSDALAAAQEAVAVCRELADHQEGEFRPHLARALQTLGRRQHDLRHTDAAALEEAVELLRGLAVPEPDVYQTDLAESLVTLGLRLTGDGERALILVDEAMTVYRRLVWQGREAYRPQLADALDSMGILAAGLGRQERAVANYQESVELYRELASESPAAYLPELARTLGNLQISLGAVDRDGEALAAAGESAEIYRRLADANPFYLSNLADATGQVGSRLWWSDRRPEALEAVAEAVDLYRELAGRTPEAYRSGLASTLVTYSSYLIELGRGEDAAAPMEEVLGIRRRLAAENPLAHRGDLAVSLTDLGSHFAVLGWDAAAVAITQEAVGLYRELAAGNPAAYRPDLAKTLRALAKRLPAIGADAFDTIEESVGILRELARASQADYLHEFALSLDDLRDHLTENNPARAITVAAKAVTAWRRLSATSPDTHQKFLVYALGSFGRLLASAGRNEEALAPAREVADIYENLVCLDADRYHPALAEALTAYGRRLGSARHEEAAMAAHRRAVRMSRWSGDTEPLVKALEGLETELACFGRWKKSLAPAAEVVRIYQRLAAADPVAHRRSLAEAAQNYAGRLATVGRHEEALVPLRASVKIYRQLADPIALAEVLAALGECLEILGDRRLAYDLRRQAAGLRGR